MKKKKIYTFILVENSSSKLRKITVGKKFVYAMFSAVLVLFLVFTAVLTDYFGLYVDRWELSQLQKENKDLKHKVFQVDNQLKDLEKQVHKVSDFSKRLQLITNISIKQINKQLGFGKIHSNMPITTDPTETSFPERELSSIEQLEKVSSYQASKEMEKPLYFNEKEETSIGDVRIRIEKLKEKSELVKQDTWTLYTDLLEKQEILHNTPSILPTKGWISSRFGYRNETIYVDHEPYFHRGMDIASREGNPVMATADGKVVYTSYDEYGYGNLIVIDHGYGLKTYYGHLAEIKTRVGQAVQRGKVIASVGSTGRTTGPHLHYEVRIFGVPVNPENYILDQGELFIY